MNEVFKRIVQNTNLQTFLVVGGLLVALINAWIAWNLAPLTQNLLTITQQVHANTDKISADEKLIPQFYQMQTTVIDTDNRLARMEGELDNINNYLRK